MKTQSAHVDTFARDHLPPHGLWPQFIFTRSELQYPERLNCVVQFLDRWVELSHGDEPCIFSPTVSYSYSELQLLVNRIANILVGKLGLVTGGRVLLRSANSTSGQIIALIIDDFGLITWNRLTGCAGTNFVLPRADEDVKQLG